MGREDSGLTSLRERERGKVARPGSIVADPARLRQLELAILTD
jgi:hypothetical protein